MPRKSPAPAAPPVSKAGVKALHALGASFKNLQSATEAFIPVRPIATDFIQFDHATRIGGLPVGRLMMIHGPSNEGKSMFCLGLARSYISRGSPVLYVDSERTLDDGYCRFVCGDEVFKSPLFFGLRPESYDETVDRVREFVEGCKEHRAAGRLAKDSSALVLVDSLKKLVPKGFTANILKEGSKKGFDGSSGRGGQIKAKMNGEWCDELVNLLDTAEASIAFVARESEDPDADMWDKKFGNDYKVSGGKGVYFDSSLVIRIERTGYIEAGEGKDAVLYGERHRGTIRKTKLSTKDKKCPVFYFHSSNGVATPPGLDRARDLLEIGENLGVVVRNGSRYGFDGHNWNGKHTAAVKLGEHPEVMIAMEAAIRARFGKVAAPVKEDEELE